MAADAWGLDVACLRRGGELDGGLSDMMKLLPFVMVIRCRVVINAARVSRHQPSRVQLRIREIEFLMAVIFATLFFVTACSAAASDSVTIYTEYRYAYY